MADISPDTTGGEESAAKAGGEEQVSPGTEKTINDDGTYTLNGTTQSGHEWSKTFVDTDGYDHEVGNPDSAYVSKVKTHMSEGLDGDEIGQDTNGDGRYAGKSLELGAGGRSKMLKDRIMLECVNKGYSHEVSESIARRQTAEYAQRQFSEEQLNEWAAQNGTAEAAV